MSKLTRKELKKDPFLSVYYDDFLEFAERHYAKIIGVVLAAIVVFLAVNTWKRHERAQDVTANALLGSGLETFNAYVGAAPQDALGPGGAVYPTDEAKYKAALQDFSQVVEKYPRQKAAEIARYHVGLCQAELGNTSAALKTLRQAAGASDAEIASLAKFALGDELARAGKLPQAEQTFRELTVHPTRSVPAAMAWLALANVERASQPAEARAIYQRLIQQNGSDAYLEDSVKQQLATLPE
ncbi:MAG: tetratricopeptide repeat protein [Terriglobia bacterium]